jgi:hypothetical protein
MRIEWGYGKGRSEVDRWLGVSEQYRNLLS